jgi:hypothetical protein
VFGGGDAAFTSETDRFFSLSLFFFFFGSLRLSPRLILVILLLMHRHKNNYPLQHHCIYRNTTATSHAMCHMTNIHINICTLQRTHTRAHTA